MEQMANIYRAVALYKEDNNRYPDTLYAYAETTGGTLYTGSGTVTPLPNAVNRQLFKATGGKYLNNPSLFYCPDNVPQNLSGVTTAVYPAGDGITRAGQMVTLGANPAYYYTADSYDIGPQVDGAGNAVKSGGNTVVELHYSLDWSGMPAGAGDYPNQLKYANNAPADKTVITWCTFHAAVAKSNVIPVLMLSGAVKPVPSDQFVKHGPLNFKF